MMCQEEENLVCTFVDGHVQEDTDESQILTAEWSFSANGV